MFPSYFGPTFDVTADGQRFVMDAGLPITGIVKDLEEIDTVCGELIDAAERKIMQINEKGPKAGGPVDVNPLLNRAVQRIDDLYNAGGDITGLSTGYSELDSKTSGLQRSDLVIVAG